MSGHPEALFSAAYDGLLGSDERAGFDRHLAECPVCAARFAEMSTVVDALHELGPARMPRPVRLPEGSPASVRSPAGLPPLGGWWGRAAAGVAAAAVLAGAAGVAMLVAGHLRSAPQGGGSAAYSQANGSVVPVPHPQAAPGACSGGCLAAPVEGCTAQPLAAAAGSAEQVPSGFGNRDVQDDGTTRVVIATQASSFAPGQTVDIYARLIDDHTGAVYLPCTYLAEPTGGGEVAVPGASRLSRPATPAAGITVDGQPILQVTVPTSASAGETMDVVVEVPGTSGSGGPRLVTLSIQMT